MNPWLYINVYEPLHSFCFHTPFITNHIFIRKHNLRVLLPYWQPGKPSKWYSKPYSTPLKINISHQKISNNHNNWKGSIFRWVEPPVFFQGVYFRCHQLRFLFGVPRPITPQQFHCYSAQGGWPSGELLEFDANSFSESVAWMLWKIAFHFFFLLRNIVSYKSYMLSPEFCFCMFLVKKPSQRMIHKLQGQRMLCPKSWVKGSMPTRFPIETPFNVHMAAIFRAFDAKWDLASVSPVSSEMFHTQ